MLKKVVGRSSAFITPLNFHVPSREIFSDVEGSTSEEEQEAYTSHNTHRLDVDGVVKKILSTDYVQEELKGIHHN